MVIAGIAPDLDYASYWGGAGSYLRYHRGALHGFAGASVAACALAGLACLVSRRFPLKQASSELRYLPAAAASALGIFVHLTLDFFSGPGERLLWPWSMSWSGCEIVKSFDPLLLVILAMGILLPELIHLVGEEIGERGAAGPRGKVAAIVALGLAAGYLGMRAELRIDAIRMLNSHEFHRRPPTSADAFPASVNPFVWRGVVATDATIEEVIVPAGNEEAFDPDRSVTFYKPANSPELQTALETRDAKRFIAYARFPFAKITGTDEGFTVQLRDLRFALSNPSSENIVAIIELNQALQVQSESFQFAAGLSE